MRRSSAAQLYTSLPSFYHRELDEITYHRIADATLDELAEFFENLGDSGLCHQEFDVNFTVRNLNLHVLGGGSVVDAFSSCAGRRLDCEVRR